MDNRYLNEAYKYTKNLENYAELIKVKMKNNAPVTDSILIANIIATEKTNSLLRHIIELLTHPEEIK